MLGAGSRELATASRRQGVKEIGRASVNFGVVAGGMAGVGREGAVRRRAVGSRLLASGAARDETLLAWVAARTGVKRGSVHVDGERMADVSSADDTRESRLGGVDALFELVGSR
jgi:hypothetical protein